MMTLENSLFFLSFLIYLISAVIFLAASWFQSGKALRPGFNFFSVALLVHTAALTARSLAGGRLPFATMYEFTLFMTWGLALLYFFVGFKHKFYSPGVIILPLEVLLLGYAATAKAPAGPLVPALQSVWLQFHVITAIGAYSFFALSCAAAILRLTRGGVENPTFASVNQDKLIYYLIATGFPFMTLVLITGAVWAEEVWGSWWNWDPKETWALITWLIYAIYLHLCRAGKWDARTRAWVAVAGFGAVIFTLIGVTLLMPGAHSY